MLGGARVVNDRSTCLAYWQLSSLRGPPLGSLEGKDTQLEREKAQSSK